MCDDIPIALGAIIIVEGMSDDDFESLCEQVDDFVASPDRSDKVLLLRATGGSKIEIIRPDETPIGIEKID